MALARQGIRSMLSSLLGRGLIGVGSSNFGVNIPNLISEYIGRTDFARPRQAPSPTPGTTQRQDINIPTPTPTPQPRPSTQDFRAGFEEYGSPLATASGQFANAAQQYSLPDPYLPAVLALLETSGGLNQRFANNPFNWGMQDMPSLDYAIDRIYSGIGGRMPYYQNYLQSGNIADFLPVYTPPGGANPELDELIARYEALRALFPGI